MSEAANDDVLSLPDAAACLHMHPVTLRNVMNSKGRKPPGEKIGGRWKFYRPGLLAYLAGTPNGRRSIWTRRNGTSQRRR